MINPKLMTPEEIKLIVTEVVKVCQEHSECDFDEDGAIANSIRIVSKLAALSPAKQEQQGWININDIPAPDDKEIMCYSDKLRESMIGFAHTDNDGYCQCESNHETLPAVSHWREMPLPPPPSK